MRLIDADKFRDELLQELPKEDTDGASLLVQLFALSVDTAQTVDAVPVVHGRWIIKHTATENEYTVCSNCRTDFSFRTDKGTIAKMDMRESRFCPNCGAKMDGGAE